MAYATCANSIKLQHIFGKIVNLHRLHTGAKTEYTRLDRFVQHSADALSQGRLDRRDTPYYTASIVDSAGMVKLTRNPSPGALKK